MGVNAYISTSATMSDRIDPQNAKDMGWRGATRALEHRPHFIATMLSLESNGPIKDWVCPRCSATKYSTTSVAPSCIGGYVGLY